MINNIANLATNIIDVSLIYFFLRRVFSDVEIKSRNLYSALFAIILANTVINNIAGIVNFSGFIVIILLMTLGFSLIIKKDILTLFLVLLFGVIIMFILELVVVYMLVYIFKIPPHYILSLTIYRLIAIILAKICFFLVANYWLHKLPIMLQHKHNKQTPFAFILLFNAIIIYMTFILYKYMEIINSTDYLILFAMTAGSLVFSWLIYLFTRKMISQEQQEELMRIKLREYENQTFYLKNMEDLMENFRAQRHDFNNYVSTLYGLIQLGKNEEAKQYIMNLDKNLAYFNEVIDTEHPVITALINVKYQKAVREKIKMNLEIRLPECITLDYIDLSVILGNLLDNAIEACIKSNKPQPYINLSMYVEDNQIIIRVENSKNSTIVVDTSAITSRYTTKSDKESHGYGMQNINGVVEQYKGVLQLEDKIDIFKIDIALPSKRDVL